MTGNNPNVDLVNMNACIKFGNILSICFKKRSRNESQTITLIQMYEKMMCKNPNLDLVNFNAYMPWAGYRPPFPPGGILYTMIF